jgi:hypothetical protein
MGSYRRCSMYLIQMGQRSRKTHPRTLVNQAPIHPSLHVDPAFPLVLPRKLPCSDLLTERIGLELLIVGTSLSISVSAAGIIICRTEYSKWQGMRLVILGR